MAETQSNPTNYSIDLTDASVLLDSSAADSSTNYTAPSDQTISFEELPAQLSGLKIYDVSNPSTPVEPTSFEVQHTYCIKALCQSMAGEYEDVGRYYCFYTSNAFDSDHIEDWDAVLEGWPVYDETTQFDYNDNLTAYVKEQSNSEEILLSDIDSPPQYKRSSYNGINRYGYVVFVVDGDGDYSGHAAISLPVADDYGVIINNYKGVYDAAYHGLTFDNVQEGDQIYYRYRTSAGLTEYYTVPVSEFVTSSENKLKDGNTGRLFFLSIVRDGVKGVSLMRTISIDSKPLSVEVDPSDKVFDGTTDCECTCTLGGIIAGDDVALDYAAYFVDANVGENKDLVFKTANGEGSSPVLKGESVDNYSLSSDAFTGHKADITPLPVSASLKPEYSYLSKVYDGDTGYNDGKSELVAGVTKLADYFTFDYGDVPAASNIVVYGEFADKNSNETEKGSEVPYSASKPNQLSLDFSDISGNYSFQPLTVPGLIRRKQLTVSNVAVNDSCYHFNGDYSTGWTGDVAGFVEGDAASVEVVPRVFVSGLDGAFSASDPAIENQAATVSYTLKKKED